MESPPYDPRAVANLLLDIAVSDEGDPYVITNVALQKLLYFAHGHFLIQYGVPLVVGAFEAWTYGPVHPTVYHAFKGAGREPISVRATAKNIMTGEVRHLESPRDSRVRRLIHDILRAYGNLGAGRLIEISHAPKGPWDTVVNKAKTSVALGLRIPDTVTVECFKHQKIAVGAQSRFGDQHEDSPFVGS